jgi:plasmid stabilization system protein ParE
MRVIYHRLAVRDVREIIEYYEREAGGHLADRFFDELIAIIKRIQDNPGLFPPLDGAGLRRGNLTTFPYHILYEELSHFIKVMVVRHHRRNPNYGRRRR